MGDVKKARTLQLPDFIPNALESDIKSGCPATSWVSVTPDLAASWLDQCNSNNRSIRQDHVNRLAADMLANKWRGRNGEAIRFDTSGRLVDGQHRLWACVQSGKAFETLLVRGVDPADYSTIGIGAKKSFGDFLGPVHGEKNVFLLASSLRLVWQWSHGCLASPKDARSIPTISELQDCYRDHPNLRESVVRVAGMSSLKRLLTPSYAVLIHYAATLENKNAVAESFFDRLGSGLGLYENDPVYQLRKFLLSQKGASPGNRRAGQTYVLALTIKAWNASKQEQKVSRLVFKVDEGFPQL